MPLASQATQKHAQLVFPDRVTRVLDEIDLCVQGRSEASHRAFLERQHGIFTRHLARVMCLWPDSEAEDYRLIVMGITHRLKRLP